MRELNRERYTIFHQGAPIGVVDAVVQKEFAAGPVTSLPAYETLRPQITEASRAMRDQGATAPATDLESRDRRKAAMNREKELGYELELRDERGETVAVDSIWLNDLGEGSRLSAIIIFKGASSTIRTMLRPGRGG